MKLDLPPKDPKKIRDVLVYFAYKAPHLTATRLQKLFYAAELKSIERTGKRLTSARFLSYYYGPFSPDLALVADGFRHEDLKIQPILFDGHKGRVYKPSINETKIGLSKEEIGVLQEVLKEYGYRKTKAIIEDVKGSEPFIWSKIGEEIDFNAYKKCCSELYRDAAVSKEIKENIKTNGKVFSNTKDLTKALESE